MTDVAAQLESLRARIASHNEADTSPENLQYLAIIQTGDVFHLDFYGECFEKSFIDLLNTIAAPDVARSIGSLVFRGPDEGANGTLNWNIEPMLATDATFSRLERFSIRLNQPGDHNCPIAGADYDENGVLAKLLSKAPRVHELTVPSAPDSSFFEVGERPVRCLSVDAGYDTQDFVANFARSSCFPNLKCLEWGEYNQTHMDDYLENCTPMEHYQELFRSNAFGSVTKFVWRNPACTDDEIKDLKTLKPGLQLLVVRYSDEFV